MSARRSEAVSLSEKPHGPLHALLYRPLRIHNDLWQRNFLKPRLHPQVQRKITVARRMILPLDPSARRVLRTHTLHDPTVLPQSPGMFHDTLNLVPARKWTAIKKHIPCPVLSHDVSLRLQHDTHAEVILLGGILNIGGREQCPPDLIFVENNSRGLFRQGPRERAFARSGQTRHHHNHGKFSGRNYLGSLLRSSITPASSSAGCSPASIFDSRQSVYRSETAT